MTVAELIKHLKHYPGHAIVMIPGQEEGYDKITERNLPTIMVQEKEIQYGWCGKYEEVTV